MLPANWRSLSSEVLFLQYQKPAMAKGDKETVREIAAEFRKRLEKKGLTYVQGWGWLPVEAITDGLQRKILVETDNGGLAIVKKEIQTHQPIKVRGRIVTGETKTQVDLSAFHEWMQKWGITKAKTAY